MRSMRCVLVAGLGMATMAGMAQAPVVKPAAASQRGTVKSVAGNTLTVTTDAGAPVVITVPDGAKLVQVAPGEQGPERGPDH